MKPSLCRLASLAVLLAAVAGGSSEARPPKDSSAVVKASAEAGKADADGKQTVTVTLVIDKSWHVYANPVGLQDLVDAQTVVTFAAKEPVRVLKLDYPPGKSMPDKVLGSDYKVYEDRAEIKAVVQRAKGDASPLEATVAVQACNDRTCLFPARLKATAP